MTANPRSPNGPGLANFMYGGAGTWETVKFRWWCSAVAEAPSAVSGMVPFCLSDRGTEVDDIAEID